MLPQLSIVAQVIQNRTQNRVPTLMKLMVQRKIQTYNQLVQKGGKCYNRRSHRGPRGHTEGGKPARTCVVGSGKASA